MPRGGAVNDDALGCTAQAAWVIDGATSIGRSVLGVESDARWLAQAVDRHLRLLLEVEPEQSSETLLRRLLNDIRATSAPRAAATGTTSKTCRRPA